MLLWILLIQTVMSAPTDEFRSLVNEGEMVLNDEMYFMRIVPSGFSPHHSQKKNKPQISDLINKEQRNYKIFTNSMARGHTMKGLTFNIYDNNMREAAIALSLLLQDVDEDNIQKVEEWARENINNDMFEYALRIVVLYSNKFVNKEILPPFILKPNYFVNSETISKASKLKINNGHYYDQEANVNGFYRTNDVITINTNYSAWNLQLNDVEENLNYFREDIALNSYYYGLHLLHPFWMSNDDLDKMNPRHAEHYYFTHQQLMTRYLLEENHVKRKAWSKTFKCDNNYNPSLIYDNGLPFPVRSSIRGEWSPEKDRLQTIDLAIQECITRKLIIMDNGKRINITNDNHIDLLAKLIRANLDGIKTAEIVRSLFGYGTNTRLFNMYNPSPSVLHHPVTTLRDPIYWTLMRRMLHYFGAYKKSMEPFEISQLNIEDIKIVDSNFTKITTCFDYYQFSLNKIWNDDNYNYTKSPLTVTARQRRLKHLPFMLNFTVESKEDKDVIVRLFLGPYCMYIDCWRQFFEFYELDNYIYKLKEGSNIISWSTESTDRFSFDDYYNLETFSQKKNRYNMFKFPGNLVIPRGLEEGLNLTMFIMITPAENSVEEEFTPENNIYRRISYEVDRKPLGFPFHRRSIVNIDSGSNFKFYNISIFHKRHSVDNSGYFSPHLY